MSVPECHEPMNSVKKAILVARYLGPGFVAARLGMVVAKKMGITRRSFAPRTWHDIARYVMPAGMLDTEFAQFKRDQNIAFLFPWGAPPAIHWDFLGSEDLRVPDLAERVRLLAGGRVTYFLEHPSPSAIDWHRNPFDGSTATSQEPWFEIPDFDPKQGDARMLWEPSRAAWAIDLARAHAAGLPPPSEAGGASHAELFWRLFESWMQSSPPWRGFQWKCGQESSVRLMALSFAFRAFASDPATTPARIRQFACLAWATGYRVFHHIRYAISQKNNHALSEACGLMLVNHLFPEFREASAWGERGRTVLLQELDRQAYADGSYVQHSMNYHRVMLHVCLLAFRLAELSGRPFGRPHYERLAKSGEFVRAMMDPISGEVPRYGNNDGACVLPLNECGFWNFCPVVSAIHFLAHRERLFSPGPWDEDLFWLFGSEATAKEQAPTVSPSSTKQMPCMQRFDAGGYYTIRQRNSWAMIRCHTYRDRPGHRDALHLDLWWQGLNILRDSGTYQYYVPLRPDLEEYFGSLRAHNTIELDEVDPFEQATRFLWFPWPRAVECQKRSDDPVGFCFSGERYDYARKPWNTVHRRTVIATAEDCWVITDELIGRGVHSAKLRWHMLDAPVFIDESSQTVRLETRKGLVSLAVRSTPTPPLRFELIRGRSDRGVVQGMNAGQYHFITPAPTLEVEIAAPVPIQLVTTVTFAK